MRRLDLRRARRWPSIGVFFVLPVVARARAEPDRLRPLRARRPRQPALRRARQLRATCCSTPLFWQALGNTLYFVVVGVPLSIALSLGAALLLQSPLARFKAFFRTALFAPVVTTLVAVAVIWRYLFHTRYGLVNYALGAARHRAGRLARRSALGDAGDHPVRGVEELRLQHDHLRSPRCRRSRATCTKPRASTARRAWRQFRAHHAADAARRRCCWSAS